MREFRQLFNCTNSQDCCNDTKISLNFRPVCDLNERRIKKSFRH